VSRVGVSPENKVVEVEGELAAELVVELVHQG
jgi:hypothetical protein